MDDCIMNVEQTVEFLGIGEKTLIKLLREEHVPARKIGREWRFSKEALIEWLSGGDSLNYINRNEFYQVSADEEGKTSKFKLFDKINAKIELLRVNSSLNQLLKLEKDIDIPDDATLRVSYKQQREVEKLEFKLFWPMRCGYKINPEQGKNESIESL
jgi:excisionase family DNA binding protein